MWVPDDEAKELWMRRCVLFSAFLGACAIRPTLPGTIDIAQKIVRPEQGCIQGVYARTRYRPHYRMTELRKNGTALAVDERSGDFAVPLQFWQAKARARLARSLRSPSQQGIDKTCGVIST